jgi:rRNA maturation protein Nop10
VNSLAVQNVEIITVDKRSSDVYSASFYVQSDSRPNLRHHVTIWFTYAIEEDFFGRVVDIAIELKKYSCTCEHFVFRAQRCKHVEKAIYTLKEMIKSNGGGL